MFGPLRHNSPAEVPVDGALREKALVVAGGAGGIGGIEGGMLRMRRARKTRAARSAVVTIPPARSSTRSAPTSRSLSPSSSAHSSPAPARCSPRRFIRSPTRGTRACYCWNAGRPGGHARQPPSAGESAVPAVREAIRQFLQPREEIVEIASMITRQQGGAIMLSVKARMRRTTAGGELVAAIPAAERRCRRPFRR
jgi:hypothetical protein